MISLFARKFTTRSSKLSWYRVRFSTDFESMQNINYLIYRCFYTLQFLTLLGFLALSENAIIKKARGRSLELYMRHIWHTIFAKKPIEI